jgi:tRNA A-37 threonylcarbamoyl transferase component Bud32
VHRVGSQILGERYEILRRIGAGSMGVVYAARDRVRGEVVALKTLAHADPAARVRLKQEFRALADVGHPNLVALHELHADERACYFTMELVEGATFLEHVRPVDAPARPPAGADELDAFARAAAFPEARLDLARLHAALGQLADAVAVLHRAGVAHRDLKPSNVLVTPAGRVVVLDFGLATAATHDDPDGLTGTAAYMAPEQAAHAPGGPASDWYAVGVMLYEALAGRRPHVGPLLQVLRDKRSVDPPPLPADAPPALAGLCADLLRRDPDARPGDAEVLRRLARDPALATPPPRAALVGRARHLAALQDALAATARGQAVAVHVHGPSGAGKSALVRRFLAELAAADPPPLLLTGRCHVRESLPFKALDPVVDGLARVLAGLPDDEARALAPRDLWALARLFPALQAAAAGQASADVDQATLRRRAFAALRELLARLAARRRVVIAVDDLQWADADAAALLADLVRPPAAPPLLLIVGFRGEEVAHRPFLRALLAACDGDARRALEVGPLGDAETRELVVGLIGDPAAARPFLAPIVRESGGSPFLAEQLAHHVTHEPGVGATGVTLAEMIDAKLRRAPPGARALLDVLALAGQPLPAAVARAAAGLADERPLVKALRAAGLLRVAGDDALECYHDRIREALAARLEGRPRAAVHRALADALLAGPRPDPAARFIHLRGAGDREAARRAALAAAQEAAAALAFDQAAQFFRHALDDMPEADPDRVRAEEGLADALAAAGRCKPAAEAYLRAAALLAGPRAIELRRAAAEQFLVSGHADEGRAALQGVLAHIGLRLAPTPRRAVLSLLQRRLQLRLHGLRFRLRAEHEVPADELLRVDICAAVAVGLSMNDTIRGADFQARATLLALRAGEPNRLSRALGMEASFVASAGTAARAQAAALVDAALALARSTGRPEVLAHAHTAAGACAYLAGEWRRAAELCAAGDAAYADHVPGATWIKTTLRRFWLGALLYLGDLPPLRARLHAFMRDAEDRGDLYALGELRLRMNLAWLLDGEVDEARRQLGLALRPWSRGAFHLPQMNGLLAQTQLDLYTGDPAAAAARIAEQWPALTRSMLPRVQLVRVEAHGLRGRAALAAAAARVAGAELRAVDRDIAALAREPVVHAAPLAELLRAGRYAAAGRPDAALAPLRAALAGFRAAEMALHAAVAARALARRLGGDEGAALARDAAAWARASGVHDLAAVARALAPGLD